MRKQIVAQRKIKKHSKRIENLMKDTKSSSIEMYSIYYTASYNLAVIFRRRK